MTPVRESVPLLTRAREPAPPMTPEMVEVLPIMSNIPVAPALIVTLVQAKSEPPDQAWQSVLA